MDDPKDPRWRWLDRLLKIAGAVRLVWAIKDWIVDHWL